MKNASPGEAEGAEVFDQRMTTAVAPVVFANRCAAGRRLAALLAGYRSREPLILAVSRGGVPVGYEVAHALGAPLDVLVAVPGPDVRGRVVVIVDDGIATGATALAAVDVARQQDAARVVVAAPVCAAEACAKVRVRADEVVCVAQPDDFGAVGCWYADFTQPGDAEIRQLLKLARLERETHFQASGIAT